MDKDKRIKELEAELMQRQTVITMQEMELKYFRKRYGDTWIINQWMRGSHETPLVKQWEDYTEDPYIFYDAIDGCMERGLCEHREGMKFNWTAGKAALGYLANQLIPLFREGTRDHAFKSTFFIKNKPVSITGCTFKKGSKESDGYKLSAKKIKIIDSIAAEAISYLKARQKG